MPAEHCEILRSWKKALCGDFYILRYLQKYTVFYEPKQKKLYGVRGLCSPIWAIIGNQFAPGEVPVLIKTVLLPFKSSIIYDSIIQVQPLHFGPNYRRDLRDTYNEIKKRQGILTQL
jgi:hypothetical protein